ncbi:queuosine precursor transporter [Legionella sp. D16C41]|uniref:queuosine precursor transporter n=1 Tax=Legionella sp. D16C41 TaxID=3402688 RepID=UPI003AF8E281
MTNSYRIISVDDSYHNTGKVYVKIQLVGKSQTFNRPVSELYQKEWLEKFSREDVAHIAALYTAEHTKNLELIKKFPKTTPATKSSVIIVGILFTAFLILANLTAFKLATFATINFPAGLIFFPLTYVFDDILTEVYGFKISRRIIWMALLANTIIFIGTWCTIYLPPSPFWHEQAAYATVYQATLRVFTASMIGYFFGEFANSMLLAKLKVLTSGNHLWLRAVTSTVIGVGIDTIFFMHIAFLFTMPYHSLWEIIATMYALKVIYEFCALPITYKVSNYLKEKDNIDYYDFKTNFNPFSLAV